MKGARLGIPSSEEWQLCTELENLTVEMNQRQYQMDIEVNVKNLRVNDNSGDERFPFIFENVANQNQDDLVVFKMQSIDKESCDYLDLDTKIELGFGGLKACWKPSTMVNLVQFLSSQHAEAEQKMMAKHNESANVEKQFQADEAEGLRSTQTVRHAKSC